MATARAKPVQPRTKKDGELLYLAAKCGTGEELKTLLRKQKLIDNCPIDSIRVCGPEERAGAGRDRTLLHIACCHANASSAKALLDLGASPLQRTLGRPEFVSFGTRLMVIDDGSYTCMHLAANADSCAEMIGVLRSASGCDDIMDARSGNGCTPLMLVTTRCYSQAKHGNAEDTRHWLPGKSFLHIT